MYVPLPLYHNNALSVSLSSLLAAGACIAIGKHFSASKFWDDVIRFDATSFVYIGELCRYLLGQPQRDVDRAHRIRVIVGNGLRTDIWAEFQERFGIARIAEFYGASECNIAFINAYNISETAGTCPLPHKVVAYDPETGGAVRDGNGRLRQVKVGEAGLLLAKVTKAQPFDGYTDDDATEKKLLRDGFKDGDCWFITGDLVRRQGLNHVAFVDRLGDTFRWKGENVATTEVEAEVLPQDKAAVVQRLRAEGREGYWRFKLDLERIEWPDGIIGDVSIDAASVSDPVLIRADGQVLYTFASSVDDVDMGVTDIVRGADHVTNTATQIQIIKALGGTPPAGFNYELFLDEDGGKISKSKGNGLTIEELAAPIPT